MTRGKYNAKEENWELTNKFLRRWKRESPSSPPSLVFNVFVIYMDIYKKKNPTGIRLLPKRKDLLITFLQQD